MVLTFSVACALVLIRATIRANLALNVEMNSADNLNESEMGA